MINRILMELYDEYANENIEPLKKFSNIAQEIPQIYNLFQMFKVIPDSDDNDLDFRKKKDSIIWECICKQSRIHKIQK